tara:strand:+ start:1624 stop:3981 length:2358 start_codon:yes stop_codon:yes gene_type:complete
MLGQISSPVSDMVWIFWLALFGASLISLLSWTPDDGGWMQLSSKGTPENLLGRAGAILSDVLIFTFGMTSYWIPILFISLSISALKKAIRSRRNSRNRAFSQGDPDSDINEPTEWTGPFLKCLGYFFIVISSAVLEAQRLEFASLGLISGAGGALGSELGGIGEYVFGSFGLTVVSILIFFTGLSLFFTFSWFDFFERLGKALEYFYLSIKKLADMVGDSYLGVMAFRNRLSKRREFEKKRGSADRKHLEIRNKKQNGFDNFLEQKKLFKKEDLYELIPPLTLLSTSEGGFSRTSEKTLSYISRLIEKKLADFGVEVRVVSAQPGPVVTLFEIEPAIGVKGSQIVALAKDLARSLSLLSVRVVETIPGKNLMGLELPNTQREPVSLSEILCSKKFTESSFELPLGIGKDIAGTPVVLDLTKMPHLLIAGTTGSGKSVGINGILLSLIYNSTPSDVRFILIDPKMLEFSMYEDIPHLLTPVVTDVNQASMTLAWCVGEMEKRYKLLSHVGVRSLASYNKKVQEAKRIGRPLMNPLWNEDMEKELSEKGETAVEFEKYLENIPKLVIVIDELADLMMVVGKKVESLIARLAQKARAAGIHLVLATQRPSVDVITGLIKANIPARISYQVSSRVDSRTILDQMGAESLLGQGDMLVLTPGSGLPFRVHGAFVSDEEVSSVVDYLKNLSAPNYDNNVTTQIPEVNFTFSGGTFDQDTNAVESEPLYEEALRIIIKHRRASISFVQRHLRIGYNRAARLLEIMEKKGVVSEMQSNGSRRILVESEEDRSK